MQLEFTADPQAFLDAAGAHLGLDPVLSTVVATVAERSAREGTAGAPDDWYLTVRDDAGAVVGAAMRTAPFAPRPVYTLPMPDDAAREVAGVLHARGEHVTHVNGALPAARTWLEETAWLTGSTARVHRHMRLFELREVVDPRPVPGRLRPAALADVDLAHAWFTAFHGDADEQAGRPRDSGTDESPSADDVRHRVEGGRVWLWEDAHGTVVHLTGVNAPAFGVARIGPVYTPRDQRGRGWASAAVAEVSRRILAAGARPCLFTDQANPTANAIYVALGYHPVVDMADLELVPTTAGPPMSPG